MIRLVFAATLLTTTSFAGVSPLRPAAEEAQVQLDKALAKAKEENKLVLLRFSETWCHYCTVMQKILDRPAIKAIFGAEFVDLKIDLTHTPKARPVYTRYTKNSGGVPWFAFLATGGTAVATSVDKNGNVGCPTTAAEIAYFTGILKQHTRMTAEQLEQVANAFAHP